MVFKALLADESKQLLQPWNSGHARAAKGFQRIVGELALPHVTPDLAMKIVRGESHISHGAGFNPANTGAKRILLAHRAGDDRLEIHNDVVEEMLRQIGAVE